jgi:hypothetical protein
MTIRHHDRFVDRLFEDIAQLIVHGTGVPSSIEARLTELARANSPALVDYWQRTMAGLGVPDTAFKERSPYWFDDEPPARSFRTSGTSGQSRGAAHYSARGLKLMELSILHNARRHMLGELSAPLILRLVPPEALAPEMVMAFGMEQIAATFGHPELSACVIGAGGVDFALLGQRLDMAVREQLPVLLIGGSFAFVNVCDALEARRRRWSLPHGSRVVDAGGFKGRSRAVDVSELRASLGRSFGVGPEQCLNLFGMTELASQLYDSADLPVGPLGERPKGSLPFVRPQVRDAHTLVLRAKGAGLLEIVDLCILDRPHCVLTGDRGIATREGVAIAGRIQRGQSRGCSLSLDAVTQGAATHA